METSRNGTVRCSEGYHEMLCEKIRLAGIEPDWVISYLEAPKQMVCVGES